MKTTFFLSLWLCLWLSMTGHARTAATTDDEKPQMRLLFLGNSFSLDASHMLPQQLEDAGVNTRQYTIDCVMYAGATIFDLALPRIAAGVELTRRDFAVMGEGGLCLGCKPCHWPNCPFGK